MPTPTPAALASIFGPIVRGRFDGARVPPALAALAPATVPATVALWQACRSKLLPTPAKPHYAFTLRDVARVVRGLVLADREALAAADTAGTTATAASFVSLWAHECCRVFGDRAVTDSDAAWVAGAVADAARAHLGGDAAAAVAASPPPFAAFMRDAAPDPDTGEMPTTRPSVYEPVPGGAPALATRVDALVSSTRAATRAAAAATPRLVLFDDAVAHVTRTARVLATPRGHAVLVGVGGSGKQSVARVAAAAAGVTVFQPAASARGYGQAAFFEDLKTLYRATGVKGVPTALMLADGDLRDDSLLEYVNQLVGTGAVAGLLSRDETDGLAAELRQLFQAAKPGKLGSVCGGREGVLFFVFSHLSNPLRSSPRHARHPRRPRLLLHGPRARPPARRAVPVPRGPPLRRARAPVPRPVCHVND